MFATILAIISLTLCDDGLIEQTEQGSLEAVVRELRSRSPDQAVIVPPQLQAADVLTLCEKPSSTFRGTRSMAFSLRGDSEASILISTSTEFDPVGITSAGEVAIFAGKRDYEGYSGTFVTVDNKLALETYPSKLENLEVDFAVFRALGGDRYKRASVITRPLRTGRSHIVITLDGSIFHIAPTFELSQKSRIKADDSLSILAYSPERQLFQLFSRSPNSWGLKVISSGVEEEFWKTGEYAEFLASARGDALLTVKGGKTSSLIRKRPNTTVAEFLSVQRVTPEYGSALLMSPGGTCVVYGSSLDHQVLRDGEFHDLTLPQGAEVNFVSDGGQVYFTKGHSLLSTSVFGNSSTATIVEFP